jgi:hypothetical protein
MLCLSKPSAGPGSPRAGGGGPTPAGSSAELDELDEPEGAGPEGARVDPFDELPDEVLRLVRGCPFPTAVRGAPETT